jgi:hypothetical protein
VLPAQLGYGRPELRLLQNPGYLLDRKAFPLHDKTSVPIDSILPQNSPYNRSDFLRAGHHLLSRHWTSGKHPLRAKTLGPNSAQVFTELNELRRSIFTLADVGSISGLAAAPACNPLLKAERRGLISRRSSNPTPAARNHARGSRKGPPR